METKRLRNCQRCGREFIKDYAIPYKKIIIYEEVLPKSTPYIFMSEAISKNTLSQLCPECEKSFNEWLKKGEK